MSLRNRFPNFAMNDGMDSCRVNAVSASKIGHGYISHTVFIAHLYNVIRRKLYWTSEFLSAFLYHVIGIILCPSKEKMRRIHTWANIAIVQHPNPNRDFPIVKFPGVAMCSYNFSVNNEFPIPSCSPAIPQPASVRFYNLSPKSYFWSLDLFGWVSVQIPTFYRTVVGSASNSRRKSVEPISAIDTFGEHLKIFLLGVTRVIGSSRWLSLSLSYGFLNIKSRLQCHY